MAGLQDLEIIERQPAGKAHPTPILFVHGAWHGAWCWDAYFLPYFAEQGFAVKALSLRGHGASSGRERLRTARIADYVSDVRAVFDSFDVPPILVGHSMGGMVVQKFLEAAPEGAVPKAFLLASVPPHGVWQTTLRILARHPLILLQVNLTLKLFPIVSAPERARDYFFSPDLPQELLEKYHARLQDESYLGFLDMLLFNLPRPHRVKTPVVVLGAKNDTIFSINEVKSTARAYQTEAVIFPKTAHDMMLEPAWQKVADYIIENIRSGGK